MKSTAKELALGGMFTALGVVFLCLGGIVPLALYACQILASAVLLPVRELLLERMEEMRQTLERLNSKIDRYEQTVAVAEQKLRRE